MQETLIHLAAQYHNLVYVIVAILACVEGPILSVISGGLIKFGYFPFWPLYFWLMVGDLLGDIVWYYIGRVFGMRFVRRFGKWFSLEEKSFEKVSRIFHKYKHHILFINKITMGFGFAIVTLMTAGMVRIPFWRYISTNVIGQFIWTGLLMGVGYFLSNAYTTVDSILGKVSVVALGVALFFAFHGFRKYVKKRGEQMAA